tara:strand:+ start:730 stop:957 length:228 start_codon:yes stop_codon:yes gene_type:complete
MNKYVTKIISEYLADEVLPWDRIEDEAKRINQEKGWHFYLHFDGPDQFIRYSEPRLSANDLSKVIKKAKELVNEL